MFVRTEAEVLDSLTGVLWSSSKEGISAGGRSRSKLINGEALATSGGNASASGSGETQSSNAQFWDGQKSVVVRDSTDLSSC